MSVKAAMRKKAPCCYLCTEGMVISMALHITRCQSQLSLAIPLQGYGISTVKARKNKHAAPFGLAA